MSFNTVPAAELRVRLRACCAAGAWIEAITVGRPYPDPEALARASDAATAALDDTGLAQALAGHPRIGERPASGGVSGRRDSGRVSSGAPDRASGPVSRGAAWSRREQAGLDAAGTGTLAEIAAANAAYERRFEHVYLVCAAGRSAAELLAICRSRLANPPAVERGVVLTELAAINRLRLTRLLSEEENP